MPFGMKDGGGTGFDVRATCASKHHSKVHLWCPLRSGVAFSAWAAFRTLSWPLSAHPSELRS